MDNMETKGCAFISTKLYLQKSGSRSGRRSEEVCRFGICPERGEIQLAFCRSIHCEEERKNRFGPRLHDEDSGNRVNGVAT